MIFLCRIAEPWLIQITRWLANKGCNWNQLSRRLVQSHYDDQWWLKIVNEIFVFPVPWLDFSGCQPSNMFDPRGNGVPNVRRIIPQFIRYATVHSVTSHWLSTRNKSPIPKGHNHSGRAWNNRSLLGKSESDYCAKTQGNLNSCFKTSAQQPPGMAITRVFPDMVYPVAIICNHLGMITYHLANHQSPGGTDYDGLGNGSSWP